jgi:hypothetical protein
MSWIAGTGSLISLCLLAACSASPSDDGDDGDSDGSGASGSSDGGQGQGGGISVGSGAGGSGAGPSGCSDAAQLIYVLSTDNELYSFRPDEKAFTKIGPLSCPTVMQPNSMAVDRDAVAWVNYVDNDGLGSDTAGSLFKVSTANASCQPTPIALPASWYRLGMGYSTDEANGTAETLFVAGTGPSIGSGQSPGLGRIDFATNTLVPVGQFTGSLAGQSGELTGTGDARLFGFFTTTPVQVTEVDKATGATASPQSLPEVETPAAWAFSFWGGAFYLYTAPDPALDPTRTTNVTRYDPTSGTADTTYMTNIGFTIVGAGVSTCAPLEPPK